MTKKVNDQNRILDETAYILIVIIIVAIFWSHRLVIYKSIKHLLWLALLTLLLGLVVSWLIIKRRRFLAKASELRPDLWDQMTGQEFEDQVVVWLKKRGYSRVSKTEYYDRGIDIIAAKPGVIIGVQVKRSTKPVGVSAIRAAVAGLRSYGCSQSMVVTNANFTSKAISLARDNGTRLVDGHDLKSTN